jgi:hypothetical protein
MQEKLMTQKELAKRWSVAEARTMADHQPYYGDR